MIFFLINDLHDKIGTWSGTLADMQTEYIIPVDLNAILFGCFDILSNWYQRLGDYQKYWFYRLKAIEVGTGIEKVRPSTDTTLKFKIKFTKI